MNGLVPVKQANFFPDAPDDFIGKIAHVRVGLLTGYAYLRAIAHAEGYLEILEHILEADDCDVDPQNRIEKATPLHLSLRIEDPELRLAVFSSLLEAGADTK